MHQPFLLFFQVLLTKTKKITIIDAIMETILKVRSK